MSRDSDFDEKFVQKLKEISIKQLDDLVKTNPGITYNINSVLKRINDYVKTDLSEPLSLSYIFKELQGLQQGSVSFEEEFIITQEEVDKALEKALGKRIKEAQIDKMYELFEEAYKAKLPEGSWNEDIKSTILPQITKYIEKLVSENKPIDFNCSYKDKIKDLEFEGLIIIPYSKIYQKLQESKILMGIPNPDEVEEYQEIKIPKKITTEPKKQWTDGNQPVENQPKNPVEQIIANLSNDTPNIGLHRLKQETDGLANEISNISGRKDQNPPKPTPTDPYNQFLDQFTEAVYQKALSENPKLRELDQKFLVTQSAVKADPKKNASIVSSLGEMQLQIKIIKSNIKAKISEILISREILGENIAETFSHIKPEELVLLIPPLYKTKTTIKEEKKDSYVKLDGIEITPIQNQDDAFVGIEKIEISKGAINHFKQQAESLVKQSETQALHQTYHQVLSAIYKSAEAAIMASRSQFDKIGTIQTIKKQLASQNITPESIFPYAMTIGNNFTIEAGIAKLTKENLEHIAKEADIAKKIAIGKPIPSTSDINSEFDSYINRIAEQAVTVARSTGITMDPDNARKLIIHQLNINGIRASMVRNIDQLKEMPKFTVKYLQKLEGKKPEDKESENKGSENIKIRFDETELSVIKKNLEGKPQGIKEKILRVEEQADIKTEKMAKQIGKMGSKAIKELKRVGSEFKQFVQGTDSKYEDRDSNVKYYKSSGGAQSRFDHYKIECINRILDIVNSNEAISTDNKKQIIDILTKDLEYMLEFNNITPKTFTNFKTNDFKSLINLNAQFKITEQKDGAIVKRIITPKLKADFSLLRKEALKSMSRTEMIKNALRDVKNNIKTAFEKPETDLPKTSIDQSIERQSLNLAQKLLKEAIKEPTTTQIMDLQKTIKPIFADLDPKTLRPEELKQHMADNPEIIKAIKAAQKVQEEASNLLKTTTIQGQELSTIIQSIPEEPKVQPETSSTKRKKTVRFNPIIEVLEFDPEKGIKEEKNIKKETLPLPRSNAKITKPQRTSAKGFSNTP